MLSRVFASAVAVAALVGSAAAQVQLYDNGQFVTGIGNGDGGFDTSKTPWGYIFSCGTDATGTQFTRLADDFNVPCGKTWTPSYIDVFVEQRVPGITSLSVTSARVKIFSGRPENATVVFGDETTDRMDVANSSLENIYVVAANPLSITRRVQRIRISLAGCPALTAGTYWASFITTGDLLVTGPGPYIVQTSPIVGTENALQSADGTNWLYMFDPNGTPERVDAAFKVFGTETGAACPPPVASTIAIPGGGSFGTSTGVLGAHGVLWYKFTLATALTGTAGAGGSRLDIDTEGSTADTQIILYGPDGKVKLFDDDDGAGATSQLTVGAPIAYNTSSGLNYDGRDGTSLAAGTYYLAVVGYSLDHTIMPNYEVASGSTETGNVSVRVRRVDGISPFTPASLGAQNVGTIPDSMTFTTATAAISATQTKWFKFKLSALMTNTDCLDITTQGSNLAPTNDTTIGLYDSTGTLLASDDDSGSGKLSLVSLGGGFRQRVGTSWNFYGQNNPAGFTSIDATTDATALYLAVTSGSESSYGSPLFNVANGGTTNAGTVQVNIRWKTNPPNQAAAPAATALGTFGPSNLSSVSQPVTMTAGDVNWFTFTIAPDVDTLAACLDIHTEGSNLTPTNDTGIEIYNADGTKAALNRTDEDSGSRYLAMLSYGAHVMTYAPLAVRANGYNGAILDPGTYYLALRGGSGGGTPDNWNVNSNGDNSGPAMLNIRFYAAAPTPNQPQVSNEMGTFSGARTTTVAPLDMRPADIRWFRFTLPAAVTAAGPYYIDIDTAGITVTPREDSWIGLYDNNGARVADDDDAGAPGVIIQSQLTFGSTTERPQVIAGANPRNGSNGELAAGTYWFAATMWNDGTSFGDTDWNVFTDHAFDSDNGYIINFRYNLPTTSCNIADITGIGGPPSAPDGLLTGDDFVAFTNAFAVGDLLADITGIGGPPSTPDGLVTGDDFVAFTNAFGAGCP